MLVFVLQDDKGELWKEISVCADCTEEDTFKVREAQRALYMKFAKYWLSGRFSSIDDQMAKEFGVMLHRHGWKVRMLTADLLKEKDAP